MIWFAAVVALGLAAGWLMLLTAVGISAVRAIRTQSLGDLPWLAKETGMMVYFTAIALGAVFIAIR